MNQGRRLQWAARRAATPKQGQQPDRPIPITITGRWEIAEDGTNYTTDFDLIYRRVDT